MRYLGLDLGTKTLGVAITDKTGTISSPYETIKFSNINEAIDKVLNIIKDKEIDEIALGLPKNMDNSLGFASQSEKRKKVIDAVAASVILDTFIRMKGREDEER